MGTADATQILGALASQLQTTLAGTADPAIDGLQVNPRLVWNATPPAIDMYPADPFQSGIAFGVGNNEIRFIVRAMVNTPDQDSSQDLLLLMMSPHGPASVATAIMSDTTLGGTIEDILIIDSPSDFGVFADPGNGRSFLGCTWTVEVTP